MVAVLLTAAGLLLIGVIDAIGGLALHHGHRRELHFYLFFAAAGHGRGIVFLAEPLGLGADAGGTCRTAGLIWGGWDLRFASHLRDHPRERKALRVTGRNHLSTWSAAGDRNGIYQPRRAVPPGNLCDLYRHSHSADRHLYLSPVEEHPCRPASTWILYRIPN